MKIIGADERLAEPRGVKALIVGPTGVGKTSLLRTLDPTRTLFVDIEAGDLSVQDVPVDMFRLDDWGTARDLACRIGGPNPSFPANACYSEAHYQAVGPVSPRITTLLQLALSTTSAGEAIAALAAVKRALTANGYDLHDVEIRLNNQNRRLGRAA